jgi:hypothetical protein
MTSLPVSQQLTLNIDPTLPERFKSLRSFIAHRVNVQPKPQKTIAGDMDMSPSLLSRKLTAGTDPDDKDTQRFNCDDLENYLSCTDDVSAVIEYLAAKFAQGGDGARRARLINRTESLVSELATLLANLKASDER